MSKIQREQTFRFSEKIAHKIETLMLLQELTIEQLFIRAISIMEIITNYEIDGWEFGVWKEDENGKMSLKQFEFKKKGSDS